MQQQGAVAAAAGDHVAAGEAVQGRQGGEEARPKDEHQEAQGD